MPLRTRLTERLGIKHPIISAPMGLLAGGKLAAAVSDAGGLGLIGGGYGDGDWLDREFAAAGKVRVGCGFITWSLATKPGLLDQVLAKSPAAIMLSFGSPAPFAARIKRIMAGNQRTTPDVSGVLTRVSADLTREQQTASQPAQAYYTVRIGLPADQVAASRTFAWSLECRPKLSSRPASARRCNTCSSRLGSRLGVRFASVNPPLPNVSLLKSPQG